MYGSPTRAQILALVLIPGSLAVVALLGNGYVIYMAEQLLVFALLALGLNILIGFSGQFAFAHVAFYSIGAYGTPIVATRFGLEFELGTIAMAIVAGLTGLLIALPTTRIKGIYLALATFSFALAFQWVLNTWTSVTGGSDGLRIAPPIVFGWIPSTNVESFLVALVTFTLMLAAAMYILSSRLGRNFAVIRESEHLATVSGVNVQRTKAVAFVTSAVFASVAGSMSDLYLSFINPEMFGFSLVILLLTMIVVGGLGTIAGALFGALIMGILPEIMRASMESLLVWQEFVYGVILIGCTMFMPSGIVGLIRHQGRAAKR